MDRTRAVFALSLVLPLVVVATPEVVEAASITVTTTADTVADDGQTSLREAISAANADSGSTTITLAASTYEISLGCGGDEDANAGGDLDITTIGTVVLQGPSAASRATITLGGACSGERLIDITLGSTVTLRNLVLTGGRAPTRSDGGAVRAPQATLSAVDVTFSNNAAGDASIALGASNVGGAGGAIWAEVSLSLTRCTFTANSAGDGYLAGVNTEASSGGIGGAVALQGFGATLSVVDSTFTSNTSGTGGDSSVIWSGNGGNGGAIAYLGTSLTIDGSTFTGNVAGSGGRSEGDQTGIGGQGGAVAIISRPGATVDITSSTFTGNVSGAGGSSSVRAGGGGAGGAIWIIEYAGHGIDATIDDVTMSGNATGDGGDVDGSSGVMFSGPGGSGGALAATLTDGSLLVTSSSIDSNTAGDAGSAALSVGSGYGNSGGTGGGATLRGGSVTLSEVSITNNKAGEGGDYSSTILGTGGGGNGGGLYLGSYVYDQVAMVSSSILAGNSVGGSSDGSAGSGGAVYSSQGATGSLTIERSELTGNVAADVENTNGFGGAVVAVSAGPVTITDSTLADNVAGADGGAVHGYLSAEVTILRSTIVGNEAPLLNGGLGGTNVTYEIGGSVLSAAGSSDPVCLDGAVTSLGYNAELGTSTCSWMSATGDSTAVAISALGALGDHGGPAGQTALPASVLVDAIPSPDTLCAGIDQRGVVRPVGTGCDIGSVELATSISVVDDVTGTDSSTSILIDVLSNDAVASTTSSVVAADAVLEVTDPVLGSTAMEGTSVRYTPTEAGVATFEYTACNALETTVCDTGTVTVTVAEAATQMFRPVTPARVFDTRPEKGQGVVSVSKVRVGPSRTLSVKVTGKAGVPSSGVAAVALNVTSTQQLGNGFVTVYPCGTVPDASNLNFRAGVSVPNLVVAPVSADGKVCFYASADTHLLADVSGWFETGSGFASLTPARVFDTRPEKGQGVVSVSKVRVGPSRTLSVKVTGKGGVPSSGVAAVALNVTSTQQLGNGFVTVYPCGTVPDASNLNFQAGVSVPNAVIAPVSADGKVCFYASADTHLLADVAGWIEEGQSFASLTPARVFDTRPEKGQGVVSVSKVRVGPSRTLSVKVTGKGGVPSSGVAAVALNVTSTQQLGNGFVTVYPCGTVPDASNLNFQAGVSVPNAVIAPVSADGKVCFYASADTHLLADVAGWFASVPT